MARDIAREIFGPPRGGIFGGGSAKKRESSGIPGIGSREDMRRMFGNPFARDPISSDDIDEDLDEIEDEDEEDPEKDIQ